MFKYFPCDKNKRPLFTGWQDLATNDPAVLKQWTEMYADRFAYWGIPTGKTNGVLALDIDRKGSKDGFKSLQEQGVNCPTTMSQRSISGGMHLLYQYPQGNEHYGNRAGIFHKDSGVDIRGEGGYVCVYNLDNSPVSPAPEWLVKEAKGFKSHETGTAVSVSSGVALQEINQALDNIRNAPAGERNNTLNTEAFRAARAVSGSGLDVESVKSMLRSVAIEVGQSTFEANATVNSAFKGGEAKPLTSPFGAPVDTIGIPVIETPKPWKPEPLSPMDLFNKANLRKPQLFKDWSTRDIHITTADGGTGKSTMKLQEAVCLAIGAPFLGFPCQVTEGTTLYITAEDSKEKLAAMIGEICIQMGIRDNKELMDKILKNIHIKKDSDLCLITKTRDNFLTHNKVALDTILEACKEIKPDMIIFDPIASFWGSESNVNDMGSAVSKFMQTLNKETGACVEMINHVGKASSAAKDLSQFAGRGGTGLPSHSRVSRALRQVDNAEYTQLTGGSLDESESSVMINVNKFSDGSRLLNKPFLAIRRGYLFTAEDIKEREVVDGEVSNSDQDRVLAFIKECHELGKEPTFKQVVAYFGTRSKDDKISKARVDSALEILGFQDQVHLEESKDATQREKVILLGKAYS